MKNKFKDVLREYYRDFDIFLIFLIPNMVQEVWDL